MASPVIQTGFATGEIAPSLYGRVDLNPERLACTTCRNMFVNVRGGANSRAGTKFTNFSRQTQRGVPPRLISFQFSITQGLALEFGNFYMRVIKNGAYVTETPVSIGGVSQSNPAVITFGAQGAVSATVDTSNISSSYAPGDNITLAGGTPLVPAVLNVATSQLLSILINAHGTGYAVNDTVTLAGGTSSVSAIATVASIASYAATGFVSLATNPSDGDTITFNGVVWTFKNAAATSTQTTIQPTLAATLAQLASDLNASVNASLTVASYSSTATSLVVTYDTLGTAGNAYTLATAIATATLSGATLSGGTTSGIATLTVTTPGSFTALPSGGNMTQSATSGGGSGASFQTALFGPLALTVANPGAYNTVPPNEVQQASTTGTGLGTLFNVIWGATPAFNNGDWVVVQGVQGMTQLNGNTYVVIGATPSSIQLLDPYGNPVNSTNFSPYTGGGTVSRIYTVPTIYSENDLQYLKTAQSADEMTLCLVNPETSVEYAPQLLARFSDTNWQFSAAVTAPTVLPPATSSAAVSSAGSTYYGYVITAINPNDGSESIASPIARASGANISTVTGQQVTVKWAAVAGVQEYRVYKATPNVGSPVPVGALYGYIGTAYGTSFVDNNIGIDFTTVPPKHANPFARGQVLGVTITNGGTGYTSATAAITSANGSGAILEVVVNNGAIVGVVVDDPGSGYLSTDTITFSGTGGSGATGTLIVGLNSGTYPSIPGYFQQRRVYANTLNQPDTYWMSVPGAYQNFDSRIPTIPSDAIEGSPWATQVNGIQGLVQVAPGLLVTTGQSAWVLAGAGSFATNVQPISPTSQNAIPQPFTGASPKVPPVKINFDVLYVTAKLNLYYRFPYEGYAFVEPDDLTQLAVHLFTGHSVLQDAWCEQPNKLLWVVRDDGVMLSLTYLKKENILGWGRHDTQGFFVSACSVTEPPVDALYVAVQRFINGQPSYTIERMDNRIWRSVEDVWAVDCAASLPQPTPSASLSANSATGTGAVTGTSNLVGGSNYSPATVAQIIDNGGAGAGATASVTVVGGVITAVNILTQGAGYVQPQIIFSDPEANGSGASATCILDTSATFTASSAIFSNADIGKVIRMGGGIATVTSVLSTSQVIAKITQPITKTVPNTSLVATQPAGAWTLTQPTANIGGLGYLAGATVTGLADGNPITPRVVSATGTVTLDAPASSVVIGLSFAAQLQSVYTDNGAPTIQGQRKHVATVDVLLEASRGAQLGANQVDGSTLSPPVTDVSWPNLAEIDGAQNVPAPSFNSTVPPLYTGYFRVPPPGAWGYQGQVALQQLKPLPLNVIAVVPNLLGGDTPDQEAPQRQQRAAA